MNWIGDVTMIHFDASYHLTDVTYDVMMMSWISASTQNRSARSWSPSPGSPPFVKPGDVLEVGQVLCIVEAMKLLNEIECDMAGELVKKLVANGQPIEYGQELFAVRPK